eukprot:TRINITY_DN11522_c0_g1_i1.p1 TRINITY_DN11522_c0_g1~~TRINITY_DN11522_c0_g1_i1.p1  ORF type:complete len:219 (+),score=51.47 TRINITY_DN11522_c0_g1_i1:36-692(+)
MEAVWPAVLKALKSRGLDFEDVQLAEDGDREDILREIFPHAPLYRAYANTMWIRLSKIISPRREHQIQGQLQLSPEQQQQHTFQAQQQQLQVTAANTNLSSLDIWTAFLSSLSCKDLAFEDVQHAPVDDRSAMLQEVFPTNPLWRAQAASFWEQLVPTSQRRVHNASPSSSPVNLVPTVSSPTPAASPSSQLQQLQLQQIQIQQQILQHQAAAIQNGL